jgi:hypothetical protein
MTMPFAQVGQRVQVNIGGLQAPGVKVQGDVFATGTIVSLNTILGQITVQLDVSFSGQNIVTVPAERVALIEAA